MKGWLDRIADAEQMVCNVCGEQFDADDYESGMDLFEEVEDHIHNAHEDNQDASVNIEF